MDDAPPPPGGPVETPPSGGSAALPPPGREPAPDSQSFWSRHSTGLIATAIVVIGIGGSFIYFSVNSPS